MSYLATAITATVIVVVVIVAVVDINERGAHLDMPSVLCMSPERPKTSPSLAVVTRLAGWMFLLLLSFPGKQIVGLNNFSGKVATPPNFIYRLLYEFRPAQLLPYLLAG